MEIQREGTLVGSVIPGHEFGMDVANECSGIRSLFAMMVFIAVYAHFILKTKLQRWTLFVLSVPMAILGNVCRVLSICLVAHWFGEDIAAGVWHQYVGFLAFIIALWAMLHVVERIEKSGSPSLAFRSRLLARFFRKPKD
jgi:exosortase/archaeosortase family protein